MDTVKQKRATHSATREDKKVQHKLHKFPLKFTYFCVGMAIGIFLLTFGIFFYFEKKYTNRIYPGIYVGDFNASHKTKNDVEDYFAQKSFPFSKMNITLSYEDTIATISASELELSLNGKLSAEQAYSLGRSGNFLGDIYLKINATKNSIRLPVTLYMNTATLEEFLFNLSQRINVDPKDALFSFENGKVKAFRLSQPGQKLDTKKTAQLLYEYIQSLVSSNRLDVDTISLPLPVNIEDPSISTEESNTYGIKEIIGRGSSRFAHSIPGRIHNVTLAASRINGRLIPPQSIFSFNEALGDVSAATGFQPAYIIKDGKTILGDGGGVCQVSTTLFRAALNTGLPIVERFAHAYRVGYYEQDSQPGFDATVYAPSVDLKIKNDTDNYILIQATTDTNSATLVFEFYGTKDERTVELSTPKIYSQSPPPPDLYQDDPTLQAGEVKQTDFAAWGAKVEFYYKVTKNGQVLTEKKFFSNYRPWQAVFLKGTKT